MSGDEFMNTWITIEQMADITGYDPKTIRNRMSMGTWPVMPHKYRGRCVWHLKDLKRVLKALGPKAPSKSRRRDEDYWSVAI
jgi:hypothetical protein